MAGSVNKVTILGHLGRDPEIRAMPNGGRVATFTVATSESWKNKQTGERKERTEWHKVILFNEGLVGIAEKYLHKGSRVYLEGSLQTRRWSDQSGSERYITEIVLKPFKGELKLLDAKSANGSAGEIPTQTHSAAGIPDLDDDVPF